MRIYYNKLCTILYRHASRSNYRSLPRRSYASCNKLRSQYSGFHIYCYKCHNRKFAKPIFSSNINNECVTKIGYGNLVIFFGTVFTILEAFLTFFIRFEEFIILYRLNICTASSDFNCTLHLRRKESSVTRSIRGHRAHKLGYWYIC